MKQKFKALLMSLIFLVSCCLSGCGSIAFNVEDTIKSPVNENVAVLGTWKIEKYISIHKEQGSSEESNENIQKNYVGKDAIFDNELGAIGRDVCINPKYKIIRTSADTFVQNKYRINKESLGLQREDINVVTITADNQLFYQLIVTDEMNAYVYLEDGFLLLKKISDKVDEKIKESSIGNVGMNIDTGGFKEDPLLRSGVLIGLRSADNTYSTLWIYSKNREIKTISYREQLLVPRAKGFWEIGAINIKKNNSIYAEPYVDASIQEDSHNRKNNLLTVEPGTNIQFIGNNYMGIEQNLRLNVISIDNISEGKVLALSDIFKEDLYHAFRQSIEAFVSSLESEKAKNIISGPNEENFTLKRRNGHWITKSRLNYKELTGNKKYEDFDLNLMIPSELILYDEMDIPWNDIKSKLPWITDAYMSPNKEIAILVSSDSLNIYPVQNKSIINKQLGKIPLSKEDSIIMTEWSVGKYADVWANFVDKIFTDNQEGRMNY